MSMTPEEKISKIQEIGQQSLAKIEEIKKEYLLKMRELLAEAEKEKIESLKKDLGI